MRTASVIVALVIGMAASARAQSEHSHPAGDLGHVGTVHFPVTCAPGVQDEFDRAVAVLHSFFYEESERQFAAIATRDPHCAMAWWGIAMSRWHPLWEPPDSSSLLRGSDAIRRADSLQVGTEVERGYISALASFYRDWEHVDHGTRAVAYEHAMEQLHARLPADTEVAIFYALALNGTLDYGDKTFAHQHRAGAILEPIYVRQPDHPGVAHYLIHSYDFPALAVGALPAALHYAGVAPHVPHALHMPSHIFTRLGMWDESIRSNLDAAQAGREYAAIHYPGAVYYDEVHSWDYLEYAFLQKAQDREAREIRDSVTALRRVSHETQSVLYALSAVPGRYALERHAWEEAAALELPQGWNWRKYPWAEATTHFARALGAARTHRLDIAREAIARLVVLRDSIVKPALLHWAGQVEVQRRTAAAWLALAEGRQAEALNGMRTAARLEDATEKRPVTPGPLLPARELLGDMLLQTHHPADALVAFEETLRGDPGRFNALAGAMRAAKASGQNAAARRYGAVLLAQAKEGNRDRPELVEASRLAGGATGAR